MTKDDISKIKVGTALSGRETVYIVYSFNKHGFTFGVANPDGILQTSRWTWSSLLKENPTFRILVE